MAEADGEAETDNADVADGVALDDVEVDDDTLPVGLCVPLAPAVDDAEPLLEMLGVAVTVTDADTDALHASQRRGNR